MRILGAFLAAVVAILLFTGCTSTGGQHPVIVSQPGPPRPHDVVPDHYRPGPPPHAPAHGYRHKYEGRELRYDRTIGSYVVLDYNDYYYNDGSFFRYSNGNWEISAQVSSGWAGVNIARVPEPLVVKYHGKGKGKKDGKGKDKKNKHSELIPAATPIVEARWGKF